MEHPYLVGLAVIGYTSGALAWIALLGGWRAPRRGHVVMFLGDVITTVCWPLSMLAWAITLLGNEDK